jgi:hypothetical protein
VTLVFGDLELFAAFSEGSSGKPEISLCPAAGARRDLAGGQMPAMGHTL